MPVTDSPSDSAANTVPGRSSVTVVIPTYNRLELLPSTLDTVFAQRPAPVEVIVVDDGSTDGTGEYLETVGVTTLTNKRGGWGPARARNEGFALASSELIAFLDSDDLLLPGALARLQLALERSPMAPFSFGRCLTARAEAGYWTATGLMTAEPADLAEPLRSLFVRNYVPSVGSVARAETVGRIGGYPESAYFTEDHYFWLRLTQEGVPAFVPALTSVYRVHAGNRHSPLLASREIEAYLALADSDPRLASAATARLGVTLCNAFTACFSAGERRAALQVLTKSLWGRSRKAEILRHAHRHWKARRRWVRAGIALWEADAGLRDWLAEH